MPGTDKFTVVAYAAAVASFNQTGSLAESEALFADDGLIIEVWAITA